MTTARVATARRAACGVLETRRHGWGLCVDRCACRASEEGSFADLPSLCECVKASCMLPGVAGTEPPWLRGRSSHHLLIHGPRSAG